MFPRLKPTKNAQAQMLKTIEGATLQFSRVGLGNGERPQINVEDLTQMQNIVCYGNLTSYERNGTNAIIHWQLDCASVESTFEWTEYALFALDENGNEFLFSYAYNEGTPQPISSVNSESLVMLENDINVCINDAENVSAVIGEYSAYASKETVEEHINNYDNPHKVSAEDVGLGNVDNVSVDNAMPTFDETILNSTSMESDDFNLQSGEKASVLWAKVKRAISTLHSHLFNKNNPHGITPTQIKAAAESHTHSAADINSGILSVARGGTGVSNLTSLLKSLITDTKQHIKLANARYLRGIASDGTERNLIGLGTDNNIYIGNDSSSYAHLHAKDFLCFRTAHSSTDGRYWGMNSTGCLYPYKILTGGSSQQNDVSCLGTSARRIGTIYASKALNTSDAKLKEKISDAEIGFEILKRLSIVQFNFIGEKEVKCGVIAQEVFKLFQELGIKNSGVYQVSVLYDDVEETTDENGNIVRIPKIKPELENLTDDEILKYDDSELTWNIDYDSLTYYCIAGFKRYMEETNHKIDEINRRLGG